MGKDENGKPRGRCAKLGCFCHEYKGKQCADKKEQKQRGGKYYCRECLHLPTEHIAIAEGLAQDIAPPPIVAASGYASNDLGGRESGAYVPQALQYGGRSEEYEVPFTSSPGNTRSAAPGPQGNTRYSNTGASGSGSRDNSLNTSNTDAFGNKVENCRIGSVSGPASGGNSGGNNSRQSNMIAGGNNSFSNQLGSNSPSYLDSGAGRDSFGNRDSYASSSDDRNSNAYASREPSSYAGGNHRDSSAFGNGYGNNGGNNRDSNAFGNGNGNIGGNARDSNLYGNGNGNGNGNGKPRDSSFYGNGNGNGNSYGESGGPGNRGRGDSSVSGKPGMGNTYSQYSGNLQGNKLPPGQYAQAGYITDMDGNRRAIGYDDGSGGGYGHGQGQYDNWPDSELVPALSSMGLNANAKNQGRGGGNGDDFGNYPDQYANKRNAHDQFGNRSSTAGGDGGNRGGRINMRGGGGGGGPQRSDTKVKPTNPAPFGGFAPRAPSLAPHLLLQQDRGNYDDSHLKDCDKITRFGRDVGLKGPGRNSIHSSKARYYTSLNVPDKGYSGISTPSFVLSYSNDPISSGRPVSGAPAGRGKPAQNRGGSTAPPSNSFLGPSSHGNPSNSNPSSNYGGPSGTGSVYHPQSTSYGSPAPGRQIANQPPSSGVNRPSVNQGNPSSFQPKAQKPGPSQAPQRASNAPNRQSVLSMAFPPPKVVPPDCCILCAQKLTGSYMTLGEHSYHQHCTNCVQCNTNLFKQSFFQLPNSERLACEPCFIAEVLPSFFSFIFYCSSKY